MQIENDRARKKNGFTAGNSRATDRAKRVTLLFTGIFHLRSSRLRISPVGNGTYRPINFLWANWIFRYVCVFTRDSRKSHHRDIVPGLELSHVKSYFMLFTAICVIVYNCGNHEICIMASIFN